MSFDGNENDKPTEDWFQNKLVKLVHFDDIVLDILLGSHMLVCMADNIGASS